MKERRGIVIKFDSSEDRAAFDEIPGARENLASLGHMLIEAEGDMGEMPGLIVEAERTRLEAELARIVQLADAQIAEITKKLGDRELRSLPDPPDAPKQGAPHEE